MAFFNSKWMVCGTFAVLILTGIHATEKGSVQEPAKKTSEQTICPVMGGKIDKSLYVDSQGKRIYVCCKSCIDKFKKEPEKYLKKLESAGVVPERTPTKAENTGTRKPTL